MLLNILTDCIYFKACCCGIMLNSLLDITIYKEHIKEV